MIGEVLIEIGFIERKMVRERRKEEGIEIGVWMLFVMIYDEEIMEIMVLDKGKNIGSEEINEMIMINKED